MEIEYVGWVVAVLVVLVGFGIWYNHVVEWMEKHGRIEGYRAIMTLGGVAATGLAYVAIRRSAQEGMLLLACFAASGLPMIVGDVRRYIRDRRAEEEALANAARESFGER